MYCKLSSLITFSTQNEEQYYDYIFFSWNIWQQIELASHGAPLEIEDAGDQAIKHGRVLRVAANDYGHYDPSPSMNKPRFKDIPN